MAALVADGAATFLAMEQPEDLGALASGPHEGLRPASMWQWPQRADLLQKGLRTVAFHQASFGTPYAKPTRLLLHTSLPMPDCVHEGLPRYDSKGCYTGPLPSAKGHGAMFQRQQAAGSEQWSAKLCQWLSAMLVSTCLRAANAAVGEGTHAGHEETLPPSCETFPLNSPGPKFSLEVLDSWAPWAFAKGDPGKVIAALELLATLVGVRLWVPDGDAKKTSREEVRGYTDNESNESLLRKAMTTKFPSTLVLIKLAEELSAKNCELQLQWIRRDLNQLADDLTNENFASFDPNFRIDLKGEALEWRVLGYVTSYFEELGGAKRTRKVHATRFAKRARKLGPW